MDNPNPPKVGKAAFINSNLPDLVGKVTSDKTCSCHTSNLGVDYVTLPHKDFVARQETKSPFEEISASETICYCKFRNADLEVSVNSAEDKVRAIYDSCGGEFIFDKKPLTKALLDAIITIDDFFKP